MGSHRFQLTRSQMAAVAAMRVSTSSGRRPLGGTAVAVYTWLVDLGVNTYPGDASLAKLFNVSRQSIRLARIAIEELGLVNFSEVGTTITFEIDTPITSADEKAIDEACGTLSILPITKVSPDDKSLMGTEFQAMISGSNGTQIPEPSRTPNAETALPDDTPADEFQAVPVSPSQAADEPRQPKCAPVSKALITSSIENMERYLLWGQEGFNQSADEGLKPSQGNWRQFGGTPADPKCEQWKSAHWMNYYWWRASYWRSSNNIHLELPHWSRLAGEIKKLLQRMTPMQAFEYIDCLVTHFDLIRHRLGRLGEGLVLDETTLGHAQVRQQVALLRSAGEHTIAEYYEQMRNPSKRAYMYG